MINRQERFKKDSASAVKLERMEQWADAALEWTVAKLSAERGVDRAWCEYRHAFCKRRQFVATLPDPR